MPAAAENFGALAIWQAGARYPLSIMQTDGTPTERDFANAAQAGQAAQPPIATQWAAIRDAAGAVAMMAGIAPEAVDSRIRNLPILLRDEPEWKRALAARGVADLAAILQPGVKALLAVHARGQDARVPANALWREYIAARDAIMCLVPNASRMGPPRAA